eukprot:COSAG02_NODE_30519_length_549_cov_1.180000_1_plen_125_part_00
MWVRRAGRAWRPTWWRRGCGRRGELAPAAAAGAGAGDSDSVAVVTVVVLLLVLASGGSGNVVVVVVLLLLLRSRSLLSPSNEALRVRADGALSMAQGPACPARRGELAPADGAVEACGRCVQPL